MTKIDRQLETLTRKLSEIQDEREGRTWLGLIPVTEAQIKVLDHEAFATMNVMSGLRLARSLLETEP